MDGKRRVVVTGIGMLCNLGNNKDEVLASLMKDKAYFQESEELKGVKVGKGSLYNYELKEATSMNKIEGMSYITIDEALKDSSLSIEELEAKAERVAISFATSSTALHVIEHCTKGFIDKKERGLWYLHSGQYMSRMANRYGIKGSIYTTSSACASGTAAAILAYDLIKNNEADIVIVGGADTVSGFSLYGFNSLQSLSKNICKPFDKDRDGINIGEGSGFFIFEELEHAKARNKKWYTEIIGCSLGNEAYHMTSPNPEGEVINHVMKEAIKDAGISPKSIDYINAHGTGTKANDIVELKAIEELFEETTEVNTLVSSTKSRTGHCLGAAGSIELGFSILALSHNLHLTTLNASNKIEDKLSLLEPKGKKVLEYALSNSFAFAGNLASIVLKNSNDTDL
ncbi:beta-ketoacyl-[acyl-carrier-protein] synthase family protein [Alkaliphilus pronyensis]|uniref:Beta-ketoacyl-[acyl-carrier-protein] synthase family protein n=1 Tax=Alkaliphilus pronyensis TaxID=1482732 RepID=A0A6I0F9B4_9FIRM|nr:beta-ketoacyl-[acyl-carrier-protein] synthase family protein [Alkaliphilus pronyensis]KAB3533471.1 beta-ketoacyl-[acyl-carrier-protein] synthase family protein [Alkaliphilus pronyensis]